ncbi:MAG: hypothetical protein R3F39_19265 [Myxococcota bacterium]
MPTCGDAVCGDDGCGGSCGGCDDDNACTGDGCDEGVCVHEPLAGCVCAPQCVAVTPEIPTPCGGDGCGGTCGTCSANEACVLGGCLCVPSCGADSCDESDGCGGFCPCDGDDCESAIIIPGLPFEADGDLATASDDHGDICGPDVHSMDVVYVFTAEGSGGYRLDYQGARVFLLDDCPESESACLEPIGFGPGFLVFSATAGQPISIVVDAGEALSTTYRIELRPVSFQTDVGLFCGGIFGGCDDGDACTVDTCNEASYLCQFAAAPDGGGCDDGDACTTGDVCVAGQCAASAEAICDGPCESGECSPATGCVWLDDGVDCDDGKATTGDDMCEFGKCVGTNLCKETPVCQVASLAIGGGCTLSNRAAGTPCATTDTPCFGACDGAGACQATQLAAGTVCQAPCGKGVCNAAGVCADVVESCGGYVACGTRYCDPVEGCKVEYADPDCLKAGATCIQGTKWCRAGWCGDGWCGDNPSFAESSTFCPADCPSCKICNKMYRDVLWPGAYKANVSVAYGFAKSTAHQTETLTQMLNDGIRWLNLVVDYCTPGATAGPLCLCRGDNTCAANSTPLGDRLAEITAFMEANPNAVVTLMLDEYVGDDHFKAAIAASGLDKFVYPRTLTSNGYEPFPISIANMIGKNARLVIFGGGYLGRGEIFVADSPAASAAEDDPTSNPLANLWYSEDLPICANYAGDLPSDVAWKGLYVKQHVARPDGLTSWDASACQNTYVHSSVDKCSELSAPYSVNAFLVQFYNSSNGPLKKEEGGSPYAEQCNNSTVQKCKADADCTIGVCNFWGNCVTCQEDTDCPDDQFCSEAWKSCLSDKPDGTFCTADTECTSGNCGVVCFSCEDHADCGDGMWCDVFGACRDEGEDGKGCITAVECKGDKCVLGSCAHSCKKDEDCGDNEYCKASGTCDSKGATGHVCLGGIECLSGKCVTGFCGECSANSDCNANTFCSLALGNSTCIPRHLLGKSCLSPDQCYSNACLFAQCMECDDQDDCPGPNDFCSLAPNKSKCVPTKGWNEICLNNFECTTGNCYSSVCVLCDEQSDCTSNEWCDLDILNPDDNACLPKGELGDDCGANLQCLSGKCASGSCVKPCANESGCGATEYCDDTFLFCKPKAANGQGCSNNDVCLSGNCWLTVCSECDEQSDCGSGKFCSLDPVPPINSTCVTKKANSSSCASNIECASGNCWLTVCSECDEQSDCGADQFCTLDPVPPINSTCKAKKANGESCGTKVECASDACTLGSCGECASDSDCTDGWCDALKNCQPKWNNLHACGTNKECKSGNCWLTVCSECDAQADCPSGKFCTLDAIPPIESVCISKKSNGGACATDVECASTHCGGIFTCVECENASHCASNQWCQANKCVARKANGGSCAGDNECLSDHCGGIFTCVECENASHCASSQWCKSTNCSAKKGSGSSCGSGIECLSGTCSFFSCQ